MKGLQRYLFMEVEFVEGWVDAREKGVFEEEGFVLFGVGVGTRII